MRGVIRNSGKLAYKADPKLIHRQATLDALPTYPVLHFATHGWAGGDEVVSLPSGLVQAGVAGVVASLWAVNDLSTVMLMERFYRLWQQEGLTPAAALRQAQCWLRDTTNREKADYLRCDVPALAGTRRPAGVAADLYVDRMLRHPDARDYADPLLLGGFLFDRRLIIMQRYSLL